MIKNKTNLLSAKKTVTALVLCLATYSSLMDPCFAHGTKRDRDAAVDAAQEASRPGKKRKIKESVHEIRKKEDAKYFQSLHNRIQKAKNKYSETYRNDEGYNMDLNMIKTLAKRNIITGPAYTYAIEMEDREETTFINYLSKSVSQNFSPESNPYYAPAHHKLGLNQLRKGVIDVASDHFEKAASKGYAPACAQYGLLLSRDVTNMNQTNRAISFLEKATGESGVKERLVEIYTSRGQSDKANQFRGLEDREDKSALKQSNGGFFGFGVSFF